VHRCGRRAETAAFPFTADRFRGWSDNRCTHTLGSSAKLYPTRDEPSHSAATQVFGINLMRLVATVTRGWLDSDTLTSRSDLPARFSK
jgi:hypothetical protein